MDYLLQNYLPGLDSHPALERLHRRRLVRQDGDHFYVPPAPECDYVMASIGRGRESARSRRQRYTQQVLLRRAAQYFTTIRVPEPEQIQDLRAQFNEIAVRVRAGQHRTAYTLMAELDDQYLLGWGYSGALVPSLEKLLDSDELSQSRRLHTESLLVRVLLQQGEYAQAIQRAARSAESARGFGRGESRVKFRVQLVGAPMELDDLQTATMYSQATIRAALRDGGPSPLVDAVSALAMCQARAGMFGPASRKLTAVRPLLSACRTKANRLLRPRVFINLAWIQGQLGDRDRARDLLRAGHRLAAALDDRRLQGRCQLHEAELALDDGDLEDAVDLAEQAAALAIRGGSRELCRDAKETVVLANLSADRLAAAAAAARIAGRHHTSVRGLVLTGLVAYRYGDRDQAARAAFREGCALAERLRRPDERSFQLLDSHGLAACGLALLGERDQLDTAVAAHQAARRVTSVAGAVRRALLMLDQFRPRADTRILDQVRTAARGGFGQ